MQYIIFQFMLFFYFKLHLAILQHHISIQNINGNQRDMFSFSSLSSKINEDLRCLNYLDTAIIGNSIKWAC